MIDPQVLRQCLVSSTNPSCANANFVSATNPLFGPRSAKELTDPYRAVQGELANIRMAQALSAMTIHENNIFGVFVPTSEVQQQVRVQTNVPVIVYPSLFEFKDVLDPLPTDQLLPPKPLPRVVLANVTNSPPRRARARSSSSPGSNNSISHVSDTTGSTSSTVPTGPLVSLFARVQARNDARPQPAPRPPEPTSVPTREKRPKKPRKKRTILDFFPPDDQASQENRNSSHRKRIRNKEQLSSVVSGKGSAANPFKLN